MIHRGRVFLIKAAYVIIDMTCVGSSIYFACLIRSSTLPFSVTFQNIFLNPSNSFRVVFLLWVFIIVLLNNANDLYQTKREIFETVEIGKVIKTVILSALIIIVSIYVGKIQDFPRTVLFLVTVFMSISFSLWRILKRKFVEYLVSQGYNNYTTLIIGAGKVAQTLTQEIQKRPGLGIQIIGYLDDTSDDIIEGEQFKILGKVSDFTKVARQEFVNKIFITKHYDEEIFLQLLEKATELGIAVRVIPHGFELISTDFFKYNIGYVPVLEYCDFKDCRKQTGKRVFDVFAALFLSVLLLPFWIIIAIKIKLDSEGPIFYLSRRYGRGGRKFNMLKYRSMVANADKIIEQYQEKNEADGPIFKIKNDPRITTFGKILRKYSLDELPQIFNVIKGDMSLVGPRPLPMHQVQREDLRQLQRLEVRPGMTGLWQIRGRSDISFTRLVKWDVWYINNWSLRLDFNILRQTIPVVLKGKGAY